MPAKSVKFEEFQDVMLPASCLCLHYCPWLERCICSPQMSATNLASQQASAARFQPDSVQKHKVAKAVRRMLSRASAHPTARRADCESQQDLLDRSRRWGELGALQARVRTASLHLGATDPLVKHSHKVVSRASSVRQYCMNAYIQLSMHRLPQVMDEIMGHMFELHQLLLGLGLWDDPFLSWAREAEAVWRIEQPRLRHFGSALSSPSDYCEAWVRTVLESEPMLLRSFNRAMTSELLKFPDAGSVLARSIGNSLEEVKLPSVQAEVRHIAAALGVLESQWLEHALLRQVQGRTSLDTAAGLGDIRALCALISALLTEVVIIQPKACAQLAREARHAQAMSTLPQAQRAIQQLCQRLGIHKQDMSYLSLELLSNGGLRVGFQTVWGHPTAQSAVEAIGAGAVVEKKMPLGELQRTLGEHERLR